MCELPLVNEGRTKAARCGWQTVLSNSPSPAEGMTFLLSHPNDIICTFVKNLCWLRRVYFILFNQSNASSVLKIQSCVEQNRI